MLIVDQRAKLPFPVKDLESLQHLQICNAVCEVSDPLQQCQAILAQDAILSHDQHVIEETVDSWNDGLEGRKELGGSFLCPYLGSNLLALEDYSGASAAFDQALAVYPTIPEDQRPWRVMWYQDGPYEAYYHVARYQDIINLANTTFFALGEYTLEESFYWRGMAKRALDDYNGAVFDLKKACFNSG